MRPNEGRRFFIFFILGIVLCILYGTLIVISDFYFFESSRKIYYEKGLYALIMDSMRTLIVVWKS